MVRLALRLPPGGVRLGGSHHHSVRLGGSHHHRVRLVSSNSKRVFVSSYLQPKRAFGFGFNANRVRLGSVTDLGCVWFIENDYGAFGFGYITTMMRLNPGLAARGTLG
nr:hypothetical protein [Tanacetum cinerariifolium]